MLNPPQNKNSKAPSRGSKVSSSRDRGSKRAHNVAKKTDIPSIPSQQATDNDNSPLSITYSAKADNDQFVDKPSSSIRADKHTEQRLGKELPIIKPRPFIQKTKPAPFQRLPAEIRWKIYQYLFGTYRVDILRQKNKDKSKPAYRLYHRQLYPRNPKNQGTPPPLAASARLLPPPFSLVFTCKSIYCDTLLLLYSKTQFVFHSTRAVTRFLQTTSKDAQASIHHIELNHIMYHEPHLTEFRPFKLRSDIAWYLACEDLSLCLTSLRVLHINQTIWDWPIRLLIGELWSLPLLFFRGLEYADVKLCMSMFKEDKLKQVAKLLEERIMNAEAYQSREDERLAKELRGPVRANVLKLVF
ncbi:hypothetical protein ASPWEDRAFT_430380 [Aspergillus wentii DTO 134E9]|uniref:DUF7730 domain-containing protein n=1 Tax=Aspergillus wentii DTO 134E9 TaxID=1073089 RepID=A0A1L9RPJ8_ASPWE|nr:uncharacterized protein ASPWEDRAFT_430380 [Aspergillus wentii DTO 134E9]OJJ36822.1 hypothetical protein ASPWEDRAFT_430380 [Aspergillus wentii DTO 134E9]